MNADVSESHPASGDWELIFVKRLFDLEQYGGLSRLRRRLKLQQVFGFLFGK